MDVRTTYARLCADVRALLRPGRELRVEVGPPGAVDLLLVGELARLQLLARRCGARLSVHDTAGRLAELVALVGLAGLGLLRGGQPDREPEVLEQLGPDEVVDVADPAV